MTEALIIKDVKKYQEELTREGYTANKIDPNIVVDLQPGTPDFRDIKEHALWVCEQILHFIEVDQFQLAIMWFGFLQGMLWMLGEHSIEELRQDNVALPG